MIGKLPGFGGWHFRFLFFCGYYVRGLWWFRIFGYGLRWKRISMHPLLFSERELSHGLKFGNWHLAFLKRDYPPALWEPKKKRK